MTMNFEHVTTVALSTECAILLAKMSRWENTYECGHRDIFMMFESWLGEMCIICFVWLHAGYRYICIGIDLCPSAFHNDFWSLAEEIIWTVSKMNFLVCRDMKCKMFIFLFCSAPKGVLKKVKMHNSSWCVIQFATYLETSCWNCFYHHL